MKNRDSGKLCSYRHGYGQKKKNTQQTVCNPKNGKRRLRELRETECGQYDLFATVW